MIIIWIFNFLHVKKQWWYMIVMYKIHENHILNVCFIFNGK